MSDSMINAAAPVEIAPPTVQYTTGSPHVHVQFQRRSRRTGLWLAAESYHPTQAELAAHAPAGTAEGEWSDAEVHAAVLAYLAAEFGITHAVIVDPTPAQPKERAQPTRLEAAAAGSGEATP